MNLNHDALFGAIPSQLFRQCNSLWVIPPSQNPLQGTLPYNLSSFYSWSTLNLSENHLSKSLPNSIWFLKYLRSLYLSHNSFIITVHVGNGALSNIWEIHFKNKNLSGPLPINLGDHYLLRNSDFSYNVILGILPNFVQWLNFV